MSRYIMFNELKDKKTYPIKGNVEFHNFEKQQLIETCTLLNQQCEEKGKLLIIAAHDLRNPLASTLYFFEYMEELIANNSEWENPDISEAFYLAKNSLCHMRDLVEKILDVHFSEKFIENIKFDLVDPLPAIRQVMAINQPAAKRKSIEINLHFDENLMLHTKTHLLKELMDNLLSNAIKFTQHGGQVDVSMRKNKNNVFQFSVKDNGPGIPESEVEHLFEPFTKITTTPTGGESSSGLGLSIVKRLTEAQQGSVTFRNRSNGGSEFMVELPFKQELAFPVSEG